MKNLSDKEAQEYSKFLSHFRRFSNVLGNNSSGISVNSIIWNPDNTRIILNEKIEKELPEAEQQLIDVEERFTDFQTQKVNLGFALPTIYPLTLNNDRIRAFAKIDLIHEEIETLKVPIKKIADKAIAANDSKVLEYGPVCSGAFHGIGTEDYKPWKVKAELDGQLLVMTSQGIIIDDERSPYNKMKVEDYRKLSGIWLKGIEESEQKRFKILQDKCKEQGQPIPQTPPVSGRKKVNRADLPKWPKGVKPYEPNTTT